MPFTDHPNASLGMVAVLLPLVPFHSSVRGAYVSLAVASLPHFSPELGDAAYGGLVSDLARVSLLGLLALGTLWLSRRGRIPAGAAWVMLLGLLLVELWPVSGHVMKP